MTAPTAPAVYTIEEFLEIEDTKALDLVDGALEERGVSVVSSRVGLRLARHVDEHADRHGLGIVLGPDGGLAIWPDRPRNFRRPDVTFVARDRLILLGGAFLTVVPDLVVEVVSPNDNAVRLERKLADYAGAEIALVWVIFPDTRTAQVRHRGERVELLDADGVLDGGEVLPGFRLSLAKLWAAAAAAI